MTADHQPKRLGWATCPDCGGDAHDMSDDTVECLKCGYRGDGSEIPFDLDDQPAPSPPVTADTKRPAGAPTSYADEERVRIATRDGKTWRGPVETQVCELHGNIETWRWVWPVDATIEHAIAELVDGCPVCERGGDDDDDE